MRCEVREHRRFVVSVPLIPYHSPFQGQGCRARAHWRTKRRDLLCFSMKAGYALVSEVDDCWLKLGQVSVSNQIVCDLELVGEGMTEGAFL
ncbi:hypothetical protein TNCV_3281441 [Trichonephila clavipes]|nr:hypothetical protein TNCV_3281441 [Trichonephila clavipes]